MIRLIKKHLSLLIILLSIAIVLIIAFSNQELENAWEAILSLKASWVLGAFCCWLVYTGFESLGTWIYLKGQGFQLPFFRSLAATMTGFFYSNITPSAAGGQPMQISSLRRSGIPVGYGATAVTVRFIANQFVVSLLSLILFLLHRDFAAAQLGQKIWFFFLGWLINFGSVPVVLLAATHPSWIRRISEWLIHLLARLHIVQHPEEAKAKVWETLELYHEATLQLIHHPGRIMLQMSCSLISMLGLTGSVIFVYHAFGLSGTAWYHLLTLSCILFVSASYTPLPGASGAQEGGFLLYFNEIFTDGTIGLALLVWRFFTYYLFLLVGIVFTSADRLIHSARHQNKAASR